MYTKVTKRDQKIGFGLLCTFWLIVSGFSLVMVFVVGVNQQHEPLYGATIFVALFAMGTSIPGEACAQTALGEMIKFWSYASVTGLVAPVIIVYSKILYPPLPTTEFFILSAFLFVTGAVTAFLIHIYHDPKEAEAYRHHRCL
jgi:hypothetical protein